MFDLFDRFLIVDQVFIVDRFQEPQQVQEVCPIIPAQRTFVPVLRPPSLHTMPGIFLTSWLIFQIPNARAAPGGGGGRR